MENIGDGLAIPSNDIFFWLPVHGHTENTCIILASCIACCLISSIWHLNHKYVLICFHCLWRFRSVTTELGEARRPHFTRPLARAK